MTLRSTETTVTFSRPFVLERSGEALPAGCYVVETVEEPMREVSFLAYRRILTLLHLPSATPNTALGRSLKIDPETLAAALKRDAAAGDNDNDVDPDARPPATAACRKPADAGAPEGAGSASMPLSATDGQPRRQRELQQQGARRGS